MNNIGAKIFQESVEVQGVLNLANTLEVNDIKVLEFTGSSILLGTKGSYTPAGDGNILIGNETGAALSPTGTYNIHLGYRAGVSNQTGYNNVFLGSNAGANVTAPYNNVVIGEAAFSSGTTGIHNVFLGYQSGFNNEANYNVFIGDNTGYSTTSGASNVFIGQDAGKNNTVGKENIFLGKESGLVNEGDYNVFIGKGGGIKNTTADYNVSLGTGSGAGVTSNGYNTHIGSYAGNKHTGASNVSVGYAAGDNGSGSYNVSIGSGAGKSLGTASNAISIGRSAAYYATSPNDTISIGNSAGAHTSSKYSIFIGGHAGDYENVNSRLYIGEGTANTDPQVGRDTILIYGEFDNKYLKINGNFESSESVTIGASDGTKSDKAGEIQWNGTNFLGFDGTNWLTLDNSTELVFGDGDSKIYEKSDDIVALNLNSLEITEFTTSSIKNRLSTLKFDMISGNPYERLVLDSTTYGTAIEMLTPSGNNSFIRQSNVNNNLDIGFSKAGWYTNIQGPIRSLQFRLTDNSTDYINPYGYAYIDGYGKTEVDDTISGGNLVIRNINTNVFGVSLTTTKFHNTVLGKDLATTFGNEFDRFSIYAKNNDSTSNLLVGYNSDETEVISIDDTGSIKIPNNTWIKSKTSGGAEINVIKVSADDEIIFGSKVNIGNIELPTNAGTPMLVNMPVTTVSNNEEMSYSFGIDSTPVLKVFSETDGTGGVKNQGTVVDAASYFYMGDPNTDGSWRWYINGDGDLTFEKRKSGSWVEANTFIA